MIEHTRKLLADITDEQINRVLEDFTPLLQKDGLKYTIDIPDYRKVSYSFSPAYSEEVEFKSITERTFDFPCAYYGVFKPSIHEVVAQLLDDERLLQGVDGITNSWWIDPYSCEPDGSGEFQTATVHFGIMTPTGRTYVAPYDPYKNYTIGRKIDEDDKFFEGTVGIVEATREEQSFLWERYHHRGGVSWEPGPHGISVHAGDFAGCGVHVTFYWIRIAGVKVMFYEATSLVVHHDVVRGWIEKHFPEVWKNNTNATNFHNVFHGAGVTVKLKDWL